MNGNANSAPEEHPTVVPALSLPKGGGAIRGLGETLSVSPATGTASLSVPIATSAGRSGFGPTLALHYDSAAGNGPWGLGWSLRLPAVRRKTAKGLPRYRDEIESDTFLLSDADLVPLVDTDGERWRDDRTEPGWVIERYRHRIEGAFARIERWTRSDDPYDVHWRSISRDNVLTVYGLDAASRITDLADAEPRIFAWLICETRDDRGNAIVYRYKPENGDGVDLERPHERNRGARDDPRRGTHRYPHRMLYGNRRPLLDASGARPSWLPAGAIEDAEWMFEIVFDYGEHDDTRPTPDDGGTWLPRPDPFSTYRAGFEIRTARLCRRVLMFHHFAGEEGVGRDCLVRSTDFKYDTSGPQAHDGGGYSYLATVQASGYVRHHGTYRRRSLPPLEFEYSRPSVQHRAETIAPESLENVPSGADGERFRWIDLHGEGLPGILTEQAGAWFYKRNTSPLGTDVRFGPLERLPRTPTAKLGDGALLLDMAGDGRPDVALLDGPTPGFYEHDGDEGWTSFRPLRSRLNRSNADPALRFLDLTGDGRADVLVTEDDALSWYESLAGDGFAPGERVPMALDEERGPRWVFRDTDEAIVLADLSGDGLTDLARIRNGEVCYWPNLGYGRFGAKVTMDGSPSFDHPERFAPTRLRLVDVDGSGTTDLLYLHGQGVRLYFNRSGNAWSAARTLDVFPKVDELSTVEALDLMGNGTACLVWSSPLAADRRRAMRYVDLMGGTKPHLLTRVSNNLGAETHIRYAPSTRFYLKDRRDGRPWRHRLPFPVQVVDRVDVVDRVGRGRLVTRYAYHDGYFDPVEREFRGFGEVEQWDSERTAAFGPAGDAGPDGPTNGSAPALTRSFFHVGLPETGGTITAETSAGEAREAHLALRGVLLRQEIYGLDGSDREPHPYRVVEKHHLARRIQAPAKGRHGVFQPLLVETLHHQVERAPGPPRTRHEMTLRFDRFGNVLESVKIGYGRRGAFDLPTAEDRNQQSRHRITYTAEQLTRPIATRSSHRTPLPARSRRYELTGYLPSGEAGWFRRADFADGELLDGELLDDELLDDEEAGSLRFDRELAFDETPSSGRQRRLVDSSCTFYRPDDLGVESGDSLALLPLGDVEPLALPGASFRLAFTPGLLDRVLRRGDEALLPDPSPMLAAGGYVDLHRDGQVWASSGRLFYSPHAADDPARELAEARAHFFLPRRHRDPFGAETVVRFDAYDLLPIDRRDAVGNRVTVGRRAPTGEILDTRSGNDYRVLQPRSVTDANHNTADVAFDALGMVVATAVAGAPGDALGDSLDGLDADPDDAVVTAFFAEPLSDAASLLGRATTRRLYDLFAYRRTRHLDAPRPAAVHTMARETHDADLAAGQPPSIRHDVHYSDGFGREIQHKQQTAPGPVPERDATGRVRLGADGQPVMRVEPAAIRWIGSGWTVYDDKSRPLRRFEPFFSDTHHFEFDLRVGVASTIFYDPLGRAVATLFPDDTYEKVTFDAWSETRWDRNDTVLDDPRTDADVRGLTAGYFASLGDAAATWRPWHARSSSDDGDVERRRAATKAAAHAATPRTVHVDPLGRPFLSRQRNRVRRDGHPLDGLDEVLDSRTDLDIEGQVLAVRDADREHDARGRLAWRQSVDLLGRRLRHDSLDAGTRWSLTAADGLPLLAWDARGHRTRSEYDPLRRPLRLWVRGADADAPGRELLVQRTVYGEQHPQAEADNLRGAVYLSLDSAGAETVDAFDFKGNPLRTVRRLADEYREAVDWSDVDAVLPEPAAGRFDPEALDSALAPRLGPEAFVSETRYDALDRPIESITPDASRTARRYDASGRLAGLDVAAAGATIDGEPAWQPLVTGVEYDAKGQRRRIDYGNGASTTYDYDPWTFRLTRLSSQRHPAAFAADCPRPPPDGWPGCGVQDLRYTYDPVGNITHVHDAAQQTIFFRNRRVDPDADYTYDAAYRLVAATGREHLGQRATPSPHSHDDMPRWGLAHPGDGHAMARYTEHYVYDAVGNLRAMHHRGADPAAAGWTRQLTYAEPSPIDPATTSNRLTRADVGTLRETFSTDGDGYDAHGNMLRLPHLAELRWDWRDQLHRVRRQVLDDGAGERVFYVYDAAGRRVRKVIESASGEIASDTLTLAGVEIERRHRGADAGQVRETLHVADGERRLALIEARVASPDQPPTRLVRYQLGNHLGSATLELDAEARVLSYEEYTPYGSTVYQAVRADIAPKRYRYTGKERDEETGFTYHEARYYAPWLARWISADPIGIEGGVSLYVYAHGNPVRFVDGTGLKPTAEEQEKKEKEARERQKKDDTKILDKIRDDAEIQGAIGDASELTGIDQESLEMLVIVESSGQKDAVNGSYHGLMQMGKQAFEDVRKDHRTKGDLDSLRIVDSSGKERGVTWQDVKDDPWANVMVGALFAKLNLLRIQKHNEDVERKNDEELEGMPDDTDIIDGQEPTIEESTESVYLAHQQGYPGLKKLYRSLDDEAGEDQLGNMPEFDKSRFRREGAGDKITNQEFLQSWTERFDRLEDIFRQNPPRFPGP